jgi:hypothetical protein
MLAALPTSLASVTLAPALQMPVATVYASAALVTADAPAALVTADALAALAVATLQLAKLVSVQMKFAAPAASYWRERRWWHRMIHSS